MHTIRAATAILLIAGSNLRAQATDHATPVVHVVGNDYAFIQPPDTLGPGQTVFRFENRGTVRHEVSLALLRNGVTIREVYDAFASGTPRGTLIESSIGILIAAPSDTSGGRILVTLMPGRHYAMLCALRDKPDAAQHVMLGMISSFFVRAR